MRQKLRQVWDDWNRLKSTSGFHDAMLFLIFVIVSAVFWFILALNDNVQDNFNIKVHIENQPDSVTFISDIPDKIHATVRDKGTTLWRNGFMKEPTINIDFNEYSADGLLRYSSSDLQAALKSVFGPNAIVTALSIDSLRLTYTSNPGKEVPVIADCQVYPSLGSIMEGQPLITPENVYVYGDRNVIDTIFKVNTERIVFRDISETARIRVEINKIAGVRIIPSEVEVTVPIEPLVRKEAMITITPINVPEGETLLLFPSKVPVEYYVAMSRLGDNDDSEIELTVDFNKLRPTISDKVKVEVSRFPDRIKNFILRNDSVEFAIVRN